jgi:hypothetical protein
MMRACVLVHFVQAHILPILHDLRRSPFPIRLENSHVIQPSQVWVGVLSNGPSDYPLNSSFKTRGSDEYKYALGNALSTSCHPPQKNIFNIRM